jgi:hypothetical protein
MLYPTPSSAQSTTNPAGTMAPSTMGPSASEYDPLRSHPLIGVALTLTQPNETCPSESDTTTGSESENEADDFAAFCVQNREFAAAVTARMSLDESKKRQGCIIGQYDHVGHDSVDGNTAPPSPDDSACPSSTSSSVYSDWRQSKDSTPSSTAPPSGRASPDRPVTARFACHRVVGAQRPYAHEQDLYHVLVRPSTPSVAEDSSSWASASDGPPEESIRNSLCPSFASLYDCHDPRGLTAPPQRHQEVV